MYYKDLSKYRYFKTKEPAVNIGWLDGHHTYETGPVPEEFLDKLWKYMRYPVEVARGFHVCELCPRESSGKSVRIEYKNVRRTVGYYEIRVFGERNTYAFPSLAFHYILEHHYRPPQEFIDAVLGQDCDEQSYYNRLLEYNDGYDFWFTEDRTLDE